MPELTDAEMIARLIKQTKLLIATDDEMPIETKLQTQGMLKEFEALMSVPADEQDPDEVRSQYDFLYVELGEYADLTALLSAMRNFSPAYDFLCDDETDKAIAAYKAILDIDPNYVEAVHDLAHAYSDNEQLDEAIEMAKKLTELSPGDEMSFTVLSRLDQQKGMVPEAEAVAAQARMLDWKRQLKEQK